nr:unnamed protein product [Fasciola hepatica]
MRFQVLSYHRLDQELGKLLIYEILQLVEDILIRYAMERKLNSKQIKRKKPTTCRSSFIAYVASPQPCVGGSSQWHHDSRIKSWKV